MNYHMRKDGTLRNTYAKHHDRLIRNIEGELKKNSVGLRISSHTPSIGRDDLLALGSESLNG